MSNLKKGAKLETVSEDYVNRTDRGRIEGEVMVYCEMILRGLKPMAYTLFRKEHLHIIEAMVRMDELKMQTYSWPGDKSGFIGCAIYSDPIHLALLEMMLDGKYPSPDSESAKVLGLYATGKIFGYSDGEVLRYIRKRSDLTQVPCSVVLA